MSKVTDYNEILNEVKQQMASQEWTITEYMSMDSAAIIVANIYMMNDMCVGFG